MSEITQKTCSYLQQFTTGNMCTKSARRVREGIAAFGATSVPLSTSSAETAVNWAQFLFMCPIVFVA